MLTYCSPTAEVEEWKNPISAWIEYNMTQEDSLRETTHDYLRLAKEKAEAKYAASSVFVSAACRFCSRGARRLPASRLSRTTRCQCLCAATLSTSSTFAYPS